MKKLLLVTFSLLLCFSLISCSFFSSDISEIMSPPDPTGQFGEIQKALSSIIKKDFTLCYPASGRYRSAIIIQDLTGDGIDEAVSFYSVPTDDKSTVLHMNILQETDDKWNSIGQYEMKCSGVFSVEFYDFDRSGPLEVAVSWNQYTSTQKTLSVLQLEKDGLVPILQETYSAYSFCDLDSNFEKEIVTLTINTTTASSEAKMFSFDNGTFNLVSSCELDGMVKNYSSPISTYLEDGTPALFIDAPKSSGMITEILYLKNGSLYNPFATQNSTENNATLRYSIIPSSDFNNDGSINIPTAKQLPIASPDQSDVVYLTEWNDFDGLTLTPLIYTVMNYVDGYYLVVPAEWVGNFSVVRNTELKQRSFIRYINETETFGEEIMSLEAVAVGKWDSKLATAEYIGYQEVARNSEIVIIAKLGVSALAPTVNYLKNNLFFMETSEQ